MTDPTDPQPTDPSAPSEPAATDPTAPAGDGEDVADTDGDAQKQGKAAQNLLMGKVCCNRTHGTHTNHADGQDPTPLQVDVFILGIDCCCYRRAENIAGKRDRCRHIRAVFSTKRGA